MPRKCCPTRSPERYLARVEPFGHPVTEPTNEHAGHEDPVRLGRPFGHPVTDATNDNQQAVPVAHATLAPLAQAGIALPQDEAGTAHAIPATLDTGYDSEAAAQALEE